MGAGAVESTPALLTSHIRILDSWIGTSHPTSHHLHTLYFWPLLVSDCIFRHTMLSHEAPDTSYYLHTKYLIT